MGFSKLKIPKIREQRGKAFEAKTVVTRFCGSTCATKSGKEKKRQAKDAEQKQKLLEESANRIAEMQTRPYISITEATILFGISKDTVRRLIKSGIIPAFNLGQRLTRVSRIHLEALFTTVAVPEKPQKQSVKLQYETNECYTVAEVSEKYKISPSTVENVIRRNSIKPKRDDNGIIVCRSEKDKETMLYANGIRKLRQREYDNADLYSDTESTQVEQKERLQQNFVEYFNATAKKRHAQSSDSIRVNWKRAYELIKLFAGDTLPFSKIDNRFAENFKLYLLSAPCGGNKSGTISRNTAVTYFSIFKAALKQAFVDGYLTTDLSAKIKGIPEQESRREYLTVEELNILAGTPRERDVLKRAALFSALTGLSHCDIQKLKWKEISMNCDHAQLHFTQQKTKGVEYMPISQQALDLCGEPREPEQLVFEDLPDPAWISKPLKRWIEAAGITKRITFHTGSVSSNFILAYILLSNQETIQISRSEK